MTDNNHPITPPPELVQQWIAKWSLGGSWSQVCQDVALVAARWGADQELEACCEWLYSSLPGYDKHYADYLRAARRPKPPSLKDKLKEAIYTENLGEALRLVEQLDDSL